MFDYLQPDGYFKTKEADISRQNVEIARFETGELTRVITEYEHAEKSLDVQVADYKEKCRLAKLERQAKRHAGVVDEAELAAMIRQSQFEKAELHRLKKRTAAELAPYAIRLKEARSHLDAMKEKRRADSEALQG
ncbi:MAG: hypothetical protein K2F93_10240 [Muribaculaceae bacterium]|nr:hypothetical protein [Muribaculaceae bacterium]